MKDARQLFSRRPSLQGLVSAAYLVSLVVFAYRYMGPLLFRTWFFYWDEYVYAAEVMRFSSLDFHQRFFDNPGTPFMMLDAAVWGVYYLGSRALGFIPPGTTIGLFNFQHMPELFAVMRATTLTCYLLSLVLLFILCARLTDKTTAAIASLLLMLAPNYCAISSFVRTESLAIVLILSALLWLNRGIDRARDDAPAPPGIRDYATVAGILAGIAAGARLHSLAAALPVLAITLWLNKPCREPAYPSWVVRWSRYMLPVLWVALGALLIFTGRIASGYPAAIRLFSLAAWCLIVVSVPAFVLYRFDRTKALVVRILSPDHLKLLVGFGVGLVAGNPTAIWQHEHFFQSIQFYSTYLDHRRVPWPFLENLGWFIRHYLDVLSPKRLSFAQLYNPPPARGDVHLNLLDADRLPLVLLILGCVAILYARDRKMLPYLITAGLFFFSKPHTMIAGDHHIIPWFPFFFMICAYPLGRLCQWLSARFGYANAWAVGGVACVLFYSAAYLGVGPWMSSVRGLSAEARMRNIEQATVWIKTHAEPKARIAISFSCFNPDIFYVLMNAMKVPLPPEALDGRDYLIWWGHASALQGKTGYVCMTRGDIPRTKTDLDLAEPGQGTDPYTDPRFTPAASFGSGTHEVDLLRFDYR